jgi:hypothetical protein
MTKTPPGPTETRGSQKLLAKLSEHGHVPALAEIKKALSIAPSVDLRVPNWLIRGVVPAYMEFDATFHVPLTHASTVLNSLFDLNDSNINFHVFINGLPVPDFATIVVKNTPGER